MKNPINSLRHASLSIPLPLTNINGLGVGSNLAHSRKRACTLGSVFNSKGKQKAVPETQGETDEHGLSTADPELDVEADNENENGAASSEQHIIDNDNKYNIINILSAASRQDEGQHEHAQLDKMARGSTSLSHTEQTASPQSLTPPFTSDDDETSESEPELEDNILDPRARLSAYITNDSSDQENSIFATGFGKHNARMEEQDVLEHLDEAPHALDLPRDSLLSPRNQLAGFDFQALGIHSDSVEDSSADQPVAGQSSESSRISQQRRQKEDGDTSSPHSASNCGEWNTLQFVESKAGSWPPGGEVLIGAIPCMFCRTVLIKGLLSLTNKRLAFYAWMAPTYKEDENTILYEGPVTMHYQAKWKPHRRVYSVLTPTSVAHYNSATDRYKPIGARSLSAFKCRLNPSVLIACMLTEQNLSTGHSAR